MNLELTEQEWNILYMALIKCDIIKRRVKSGRTVRLDDTTFGFADLSRDEYEKLTKKINANSDLAWLRETD